MKSFLLLQSFLCAFSGVKALNLTTTATTKFNLEEANKNLWLSAAAYCGADKIEAHTFKGPTAGFIVTNTIDDKKDTQGFIGYLPSDQSIYVVFRGSSSIQNWITDLSVTKVAYEEYCCGDACLIHKGFYEESCEEYPAIYSAVQKLKAKFPTYKVKTTGHSLGAALGQIVAMRLKADGVDVSTHYNFGQPRIGDEAYARCANSFLPTERVTHLKDTVPHIPYESWGFVHQLREAYESTTTSQSPSVKDCDASNANDPTCAEQWEFKQTNVDDHLTYLGLKVTCSSV